jgi:hypothetical protein
MFEMHIHVRRLQLRRHGAKCSADDLSHAILSGVRELTTGHDVQYFAAYVDHCKSLLGLLRGHSSSQIDRNGIIDLFEIVGANRDKPVSQIRDEIRAADPKWITSAADDDSTLAALDFAVRALVIYQA